MTNFRVRIAEHTVNPMGLEAITWDLCYERFIHAEFMTHRWARNASSARAIPYRAKQKDKIGMVDWVLKDPAVHLHLGGNRPGMSSGAEIPDADKARNFIGSMLTETIVNCDRLYNEYDLHKEIVNRYIEPWSWINVVATMGKAQLMNFFKLRIDKYAHPNIQRLAVTMARQYRDSVPRKLSAGEWHLPFITLGEWQAYFENADPTGIQDLITWSVARCAWCSYKTVDGRVATFEEAKKRYNDCINLKHMTPCEHQLRALSSREEASGCIPGYEQFRHTIPGESTGFFDFTILDKEYASKDYLIP